MTSKALVTPARAAEYMQAHFGFGTTRTLAKWR